MPVPPSENEPSLAGVVSRAIERRLLDLHTALPGRVERVDAARGLVDVKPHGLAYKRGEDGGRVAYQLPVVTDVPAFFFGAGGGGGQGGFDQDFPVTVGDYALLVFLEGSADVWLERGEDVDPQDERRHHLSDAVALCGFNPLPARTALPTDATTWGARGGLRISISTTEGKLGLNAADAILKGTAFLSAFNTWRSALNTYLDIMASELDVITSGTVAPFTVNYQAAEAAFASALGSVLSTLFKVE